jgi:hypothetical protein
MIGQVVWYAGERWRVYGIDNGMARCYAILNPERFISMPASYL